ncbi:uncharacterized protein WCC33_018690 [Rhinophrynus dorsalis]
MPSSLLSPFRELDADLSKEFLSLLSERRCTERACERHEETYSSCPINLNNRKKSQEQLSDLTVWPLESPWTRDHQLPTPSSLCHIPFLADRSVSMIEESRKLPASSRTPSSRYKTELCRTFHESGSCKYGSKCQFAHGSEELRGLNRHPKYKTELCRTYHTIGFCPYGSRCHFIHNAEEQRFSTSTRGQRPHLLRQSVSCSGIPSSSSSLSLFSSLSSLSPFSPSSPSTPTFSPFNPFPSSGPSSPTSSPLDLSLSSIFRPVSPPSPTVESPISGGVLLQLSPSRRRDPRTVGPQDCSSEREIQDNLGKDCKSPCCNSQEAKRLPIFSRLSD